ncbi:PLP-dependent aminotransferase family protein [Methylophaga lonarensis]|uniref:aminotransferase-like domain-containing protein n=1 Tax=Methylophaga lonarensis TaxID=999151 RepID=UPI003D272004
MAEWQARIELSARTKYLGIVEALETDIYTGRIKPGDRLPPQRKVAGQLGVDLTTVTRAYNEANRRGLIEARVGSGSFIRRDVELHLFADMSGKRSLLDLSMNNPPQPASAGLRQAIPDGISELMAAGERLMQLNYHHSAGNPHDRQIASDWLGQTLDSVSAQRTVITAGAQAALFAILRLCCSAGDVVACGEWVYPGLKAAASANGIQLWPLAMDADGICDAALAEACQQQKITALYLVPAIDNPTTTTLPLQRRQALAAIIERYQLHLIEDDPYSVLLPEPFAPVCNFVAQRGWYIRTVAKCISPGLRLAYVMAPDDRAAQILAQQLHAISVMASPLMAALLSDWLQQDKVAKFAIAIREENQQRQAIAKTLLADFAVQASPYAQHLWLRLPDSWRADQFAAHANARGVAVVDGQQFSANGQHYQSARLSLGLIASHDMLREALLIIAELLANPPQQQSIV